MFVIAYLRQWNIDWLNFIFPVVYYAGALIFLSTFGLSSDVKDIFLPFLYGLQLSMVLIVIGFALHLTDGANGWFYLFLCVGVGADVPFMMLRVNNTGTISFNPLGSIGILALVIIFANAFYHQWNINWFYLLATIGLSCYAFYKIAYPSRSLYVNLRWRLGWYLAFLFLAIGVWFPFQSASTTQSLLAITGYFLGAVAAGLALPFLLIR
jgi:hypothetical protein